MNKDLISKQNKNLVLIKSKSLLNITNKILTSSIEETWITVLWQWIEKHIEWTRDKDYITLPRTKGEMLNLTLLELDALSFEDYDDFELPLSLSNLLSLKVLHIRFYRYDYQRNIHNNKIIHHNNLLLKYIFKKLIKLNELDLCDFPCTYISTDISNLTRLRKLSLSGNDIKELPKGIGSLRDLIDLDLSDNKITKLPEEIINLTNLKSLNLQKNALVLTAKQTKWIEKLKDNGCIVNLAQVETLPHCE